MRQFFLDTPAHYSYTPLIRKRVLIRIHYPLFQGEVGAREVPALRSLKKVLAIEEVLREVAVYFYMDREKLISKRVGGARQLAMEMSYRYTKCNQEEIGRIFGVDYSTVSQNRRRTGIRLKEDQELRRAFEKVQERLDVLSKQKI